VQLWAKKNLNANNLEHVFQILMDFKSESKSTILNSSLDNFYITMVSEIFCDNNESKKLSDYKLCLKQAIGGMHYRGYT